jgi:hypothetical protein
MLIPLSIRSFFALGALGVCLMGCTGRFSSLHDGAYDCQSRVSSNTCGVSIPSSSMPADVLQGGQTDSVALLAPDETALFGDASEAWGTVQFGAQGDPWTYQVTGSACQNGGFTELAQLVGLGEDSLTMDLTYQYTSLSQCGIDVDACTVSYEVSCVLPP